MFDSVAKKKLIFVSGKGGVGKTYIASHLALYFSQKNEKTLLIETSPLGQLGFFFGVDLKIDDGIDLSDHLKIINVTSRGNFQTYLETLSSSLKLIQPILKNRIVMSLIDAIPGLAEAMLLGRLYYHATHHYDHVIFDAPAFGHFLSMMTTPDAIIESKIGGPIADQVMTVQNFLTSKDCATILVGQPEELVISEMLDFIPKLQAAKSPKIDVLCLNRVIADPVTSFLLERSTREAAQIKNLEMQTTQELWTVDDVGFWQPPVRDLASFLSHMRCARIL